MRSILFVCAAIILLASEIHSQNVPAPYEVGTWSGFRAAAINYTFDDGCPNQFSIAIPLFDEYDFKLTLFTVTSWVSNWSALQAAAANGHEVASHTVTHPNFGDITLEQQKTELKNSKDSIEKHIPDKKCITMAYPYCVPGVDSICRKYYIAARGCQNFIEPETPGTYFNISSIVGGNLGLINTLTDFKNKFNYAADHNGWCVFLFHGIDNDGGYSPIPSTELRKSIEYLDPRRSKYWVTTFANASFYSMERNAVTVTETSATDSSMTLKITDTLPDSIYNFPVTLRRPLPENWPSADVTQDNVAIPMRIVQVDTIVYLTFDVVPDAGEVQLSRNMTPVTPEVDSIPEDEPEPVGIGQAGSNNSAIKAIYADGKLLLFLKDIADRELVVSLYDVRGVKLLSKTFKYSGENKIIIDLNPAKPRAGVYFVFLTDRKSTWCKKIFLS
jgi:peptidoglycan/xylan/chitin deacetylase (PgdA/CDA1 family)